MPAVRRAVAPLVLALVAGLLGLPALAKPACASPLGCGTDLDAAVALERSIADNTWYGQVLEIDYRTAQHKPGDVASAGAWGDSGLWTGVYLGGESYRYAVAKAKLNSALSSRDRAFWTAQRDQALARVKTMAAKYHLLTNIARGWTTSFDPSGLGGDPPSFGGGVVQGEPGMLMRACSPTDAPKSIGIGQNKRVFGPFPWEDGKQYMCETAPSRDTYAGTIFGLSLAFDLVGPDAVDMRNQIRDDILTLADFLVRHYWTFPRPHGNVSHPAPKPIPGGDGHDFDNFLSPLFVYVPLARLSLTQVARHVARAAGTPEQALQWDAAWAEEVATQGPILAFSMQVDAMQPNEGYYKYNLNHLNALTLIRLETDTNLRTLFRQGISVMDHTTRDDINAHFEAITYAITGEPDRLSDALTHLRQWREYRVNSHRAPVTNSKRCGAALECVPADQLNAEIGGQDVTVPGMSGNMRARRPLPVAQRAVSDFIWQRPPTQLDGSESLTHSAPGIDYLTPYWMLRYFTEVAPPALAPFTPWMGPVHS